MAIVLITIAGILPVLSQISEQSWDFTIAPAWATIVLGVAVSLVALDRFFGFSSACVGAVHRDRVGDPGGVRSVPDWVAAGVGGCAS